MSYLNGQKILMRHKRLVIQVLSILIISWGVILIFARGNAQESGWSNPLNLSNTPTNSSLPSLAADSFGNVHIVWIEEVEPGFTVVLYSRLDKDRWSVPVDIFSTNNEGTVNNPLLLADSTGKLHIFFSRNGIQYSWVYADQAGSALNWQPVDTVVRPLTNITAPDAVISPDNAIHLVYGISNGTNSGIYYLHSRDEGETWEDAIPVFTNVSANQAVNQPKIAVSETNKVHVIWSQSNYPETFPPTGIQYASNSDGKEFSTPTLLASGPYIDPAILAAKDGELHVVWSGTDTDRFKFHRYSKDDGETWTDTWRNPDLGGLQGLPDLVADSLGRIYWLKVGTIFDMVVGIGQNQDSLHENIFNDGSWSPGQVLLPSSYLQQNQMYVTALIARGNELHTAVMNPLGAGNGDYQFEIYYMNKKLDAPEIQSGVPTMLPAEPAQDQTPTPVNTPEIQPSTLPQTSSNRGLPLDTMSVIILSVLPAFLLVLVVSSIYLVRKTRG
jgi:hypothetical protein